MNIRKLGVVGAQGLRIARRKRETYKITLQK